MTELIVIFILITFGIVFLFMYQKDKKDRERNDEFRKTFENTIISVLSSVEKTNNKFYEMVSELEIEHFKQLEDHSANLMEAMDKQADKFVALLKEKKSEPVLKEIGTLDYSPQENIIEKEDDAETPLEDLPNIPIDEVNKIQFEGNEEIFPISIT